jgi:sugar phosphate isomerase/epimerase
MIELGIDFVAAWKRFKGRIPEVHVKNACRVGDRHRSVFANVHERDFDRTIVRQVDQGVLNYLPLLESLQADGFGGWLTIEWFGQLFLGWLVRQCRALRNVLSRVTESLVDVERAP